MTAIIVAFLLAMILQLAVWQGAVLAIAWIIGKLADISVNYPLVAGIVGGAWLLVLAIKALYIYGAYKIDKDFDL